MISVADALQILSEHKPNMSLETLGLENALGRTLAEDIFAKETLPPHNASAMDGYGVHLADIAAPNALLKVIGEAPAGKPYMGSIGRGEAIRLFTGSVIPKECDTVIMQENVAREGDRIRINTPQDTIRHVRKAGIDFRVGDKLIQKGVVLSPAHIALIAAGNVAEITVFKRPLVAIIANGDELKAPGSCLEPGQIINSNPPALAAMIRNWGGDPLLLGIAADTEDAIIDKIRLASAADIIVPIGGASVGDYDHMRAAFTRSGLKMIFQKIAVKPGKPTWFGKMGPQTVLGLPGNPASAAVCAQLFLAPLLGFKNTEGSAFLEGSLSANGPRETYLRAQLRHDKGRLFIKPFPKQDSSLITPLTQAKALIKLAPNTGPWSDGTLIDFVPFGTPLIG